MNAQKCDSCGVLIKGKHYPMYDENYNIQKDLKQCTSCFEKQIK